MLRINTFTCPVCEKPLYILQNQSFMDNFYEHVLLIVCDVLLWIDTLSCLDCKKMIIGNPRNFLLQETTPFPQLYENPKFSCCILCCFKMVRSTLFFLWSRHEDELCINNCFYIIGFKMIFRMLLQHRGYVY